MPSGQDVAYASAVSLLDLYRKRALSPGVARKICLAGDLQHETQTV